MIVLRLARPGRGFPGSLVSGTISVTLYHIQVRRPVFQYTIVHGSRLCSYRYTIPENYVLLSQTHETIYNGVSATVSL